MARKVLKTGLETRTDRRSKSARREPYWVTLSEGLAVGYRKGVKGGTWIGRAYRTDDGRTYEALGTADDILDADGRAVLNFDQAQAAARDWFRKLNRTQAGDTDLSEYTVAKALDEYRAAYERRSGKATAQLANSIEAHIRPALGDTLVEKLTRRQITQWFDAVTDAPARRRTRPGKKQKVAAPPKDAEAKRRRRSAANRILTVLKAALNHALANHPNISTADAWRSVKPHRDVDAAKVRYLSNEESKRLVNACGGDFRQLVRAALLTGCRYGELIVLTASDFNADSGTLHVRESKSGKPRHVVLTEEGQQFFALATAGKESSALILTNNGKPWGKSHQARPLSLACTAAKIKPAISFHDLRHTHASALAMKGVPMGVIAAQLGHADTRMTERHYAHLAPSYVADTIRAAFPTLGIVEQSNVTSIAKRPA